MAKISQTVGRKGQDSGYGRLLRNPALGHLISRVHATTIRAGTELEHLLEATTPQGRRLTLKEAIASCKRPRAKGRRFVFHPKVSGTKRKRATTGDILVLDHTNRELTLVELKDGDTFDTKKASGELQSLKAASKALARRTGYKPKLRFCSFNQASREAIVAGAKGRFSLDQVLTGAELCRMLGVDYAKFRRSRSAEQKENLLFFVDELASIPQIVVMLRSRLH